MSRKVFICLLRFRVPGGMQSGVLSYFSVFLESLSCSEVVMKLLPKLLYHGGIKIKKFQRVFLPLFPAEDSADFNLGVSHCFVCLT